MASRDQQLVGVRHETDPRNDSASAGALVPVQLQSALKMRFKNQELSPTKHGPDERQTVALSSVKSKSKEAHLN